MIALHGPAEILEGASLLLTLPGFGLRPLLLNLRGVEARGADGTGGGALKVRLGGNNVTHPTSVPTGAALATPVATCA